ncbi:MAG: MFS transporter [Clostridiales Family XIII bacterium]|jgi:sugar phosphate permease|nr:MFS transporter [Clostridiales Family XIII bacterium]
MEKKKQNSWIPNFGGKGWLMVLLGVCYYYIYMNMFNIDLNTLYGVYEEQYGWTTPQVSLVVSIGGWIAALGVIFFGAVCKKKGPKFVSVTGLFMTAVALVIAGVASNFALFTIAVILFFFSAIAFGIIGVAQFGANWFPRGKGHYMGWVTQGITIGSATLNLVLIAVLPHGGLKTYFFIFAGVSVVLALFTLLTKDYPEQAGVYPDNDKSSDRAELDAQLAALEAYKKQSPWTVGKCLKTPATWLIIAGWSLPMFLATGTMAQLVPALISFGHSPMFGIGLLTALWPFGVLGNYIGGVIDAKYGAKPSTFVVVAFLVAASLGLSFAGSNPVLATIAVAMFMFSISVCTNMTMSITVQVYGRADFENAWPVVSFAQKLIMSAGLVVIALVASASSYKLAFIFIAAVAAVAGIFVGLTPSKQITPDVDAPKAVEAE